MADKFKDNIRQISQLILGLALIWGIYILLKSNELCGLIGHGNFSDEVKFTLLALKILRNFGSGLPILILGLVVYVWILYKINSDYTLNMKNFYHDYPLYWYRICRWFFGIKSCNLINVPIFLQYELVLNQVFEHYYINDELFPLDETLPKIEKPKELALSSNCREFNLVIEETYKIRVDQLPENKGAIPTIRIGVFFERVTGRRFHRALVDAVLEVVHLLPAGSQLNLFATTNPKTNLCIAQSAFSMHGRGNIAKLFVYQQSSYQSRNFEPKGHKIF